MKVIGQPIQFFRGGSMTAAFGGSYKIGAPIPFFRVPEKSVPGDKMLCI